MPTNDDLFLQAMQYMPGGVNSPVRAFKGVGGVPIFFSAGKGAWLNDTDGNRYIDYVNSWGATILGHAHPDIISTVQKAATSGLGFGAPTEIETAMAKLLCSLMPSMDRVRMTNSGTEATMSAIRLARGFTQRDKIVKFAGCYHGHADSLLIKSGSGALTLGIPASSGIPSSFAEHTLVLPYNNIKAVERCCTEMGNDIACIIVEPVAGNMNCILPQDGFLQTLRTLCDQTGAVLIFDEVMTGFRVALGGAQAYYKVTPDLTTLGKIIGGGLPVGAFGGKREIMDYIAPLGPVYQAGTLSGNPIALAAGLTTLKLIQADKDFYRRLSSKAAMLTTGLNEQAKKAHIAFNTTQIGGMFGLFFGSDAPHHRYEQIATSNGQQFKQFFHGMLARGIYLAPSQFEAGFISDAHDNAEIDTTLHAAKDVFATL